MSCPICGKPTSSFLWNIRDDGLCRIHGRKADKGEIEKCSDCGKWFHILVPCTCTQSSKTQDYTTFKGLTCIICKEPSNGKHFCLSCYNQYKNKAIDIRISNCKKIEILDKYGNKKITCKDGRKVRSRAEKIIMDYFFDNYIRVVYEKTIPYINEQGEEKKLHPDFYLTDYNLFIEFNGLTEKSYLRKKSYAYRIYKEKGYNVEILEADDIDDVETKMEIILSKYKILNEKRG